MTRATMSPIFSHALQIRQRMRQAGFFAVLIGVEVFVFELDADHALVAGTLQYGENLIPSRKALPGNSVAPRPFAKTARLSERRALRAIFVLLLGIQIGIFAVRVLNVRRKFFQEPNVIHTETNEMRWVVIQTSSGSNILQKCTASFGRAAEIAEVRAAAGPAFNRQHRTALKRMACAIGE